MRLEIPLSNHAVPHVGSDGSRVAKAARRLVIRTFRADLGRTRHWIMRVSLTDDRFV